MVISVGEKEGGPENRLRGPDQWIFVVDGSGVAIVEGVRRRLRRGSLVLIERGERHEIRNTGSSSLITLDVYNPVYATRYALTRREACRPQVKRSLPRVGTVMARSYGAGISPAGAGSASHVTQTRCCPWRTTRPERLDCLGAATRFEWPNLHHATCHRAGRFGNHLNGRLDRFRLDHRKARYWQRC